MSDKQESIVVDGVEWRIGDRVVWVRGSDNVYNISEFRGDNIVLFEGYSQYPVPIKGFVNVSALGREQENEVATAPVIGGIELKPWMRAATRARGKRVVCLGMDSRLYKDESVFLVGDGGFLRVSECDRGGDWQVTEVYAAPDVPTLDPNKHGPLLWSKAGDEAQKEAEAKKKALEAAEVEFEAAKQRYNEAYAKLVAITD
jgi:hypothetical protein